jgi:RNA polymerase sigma-70 factor, ECF subfamily
VALNHEHAEAALARRYEAETLMIALAKGDRLALARLITLFGRGVQIFAAHHLIVTADADDIAQETFLRVWSRAGQFDPAKGAVSTWVYRIVVNLCIDANRRHRLRRFIGLEAAADPLDPSPTPETVIGARRELDRTTKALRGLPERQRRALMLRLVADQSTAEIAQTLSISSGAAEQLLVRARASLRQRLDTQGEYTT